jgi:hypothetical protein
VIEKKYAARDALTTPTAEIRLRTRNAPSVAKIVSGTRVGSKRPVTAATAITTPNTKSGGAGSTIWNPNRTSPRATAAS